MTEILRGGYSCQTAREPSRWVERAYLWATNHTSPYTLDGCIGDKEGALNLDDILSTEVFNDIWDKTANVNASLCTARWMAPRTFTEKPPRNSTPTTTPWRTTSTPLCLMTTWWRPWRTSRASSLPALFSYRGGPQARPGQRHHTGDPVGLAKTEPRREKKYEYEIDWPPLKMETIWNPAHAISSASQSSSSHSRLCGLAVRDEHVYSCLSILCTVF